MTRSPGHGRGMQVRWYLTVSGSRRSAPARPEGYGAGLHSGESPSAACEHAPNDGPCAEAGREQTVEYYHNSQSYYDVARSLRTLTTTTCADTCTTTHSTSTTTSILLKYQ
jgi:hypothetical protein